MMMNIQSAVTGYRMISLFYRSTEPSEIDACILLGCSRAMYNVTSYTPSNINIVPNLYHLSLIQ